MGTCITLQKWHDRSKKANRYRTGNKLTSVFVNGVRTTKKEKYVKYILTENNKIILQRFSKAMRWRLDPNWNGLIP